MKFHKFKPYVKCGLFLILVISLAGTANAATGHTGGIALSWDDVLSIDPCYQNLPLFEKYNATCTINVNSNDLSNFEQSTTDNLGKLHSAGWEVAAHGHNHEDSVAYLKNYTSDVWLNQEIIPNIETLNGLGYSVYTFVYPYGSNDPTTDALLAPYFQTLRSSEFDTMEGQNVNATPEAYYKWDNTQVVDGVEIDDQSNVGLESIKAGIDYAMENEYVLVLYGHKITSGTPAEYQTSTSKLESILNYTTEQGGKFYLLGDLGNSSSDSNVTANFTVSSTSIVMGANVTFVDYSINQTSEFLNFGDGTNSSTANVTHTYTTPGTYNAVLTVKNGLSINSMTKTIIVTTGHTGGIALSWDDVQNIGPCYENRDMFKTYNANCTVNINNLSAWGQGTTDNLSALHNAGWEIAGHGYNHVDSLEFLNNHTSQEWLNQEILPNIAEINSYGYPAYSLAYPYTTRNDTTDALLAPYFRTLRAMSYNIVNVNESDAYYKWDDARVVNAVEIDDQSNVNLESIQYGIDEAMKYGYVLVLYGHAITPTVTGDYQTSTSRLDSILNYTKKQGGEFYLMSDLGDSSWTQWSPRFSNVTPNFTVSSESVVVGGNVTFVDYSFNQTSELLDFGDGTNSSTANAVHKYTTAGNYAVKLTVKNDVSNQSMTKTIMVIQPTAPIANFTSTTNGLAPLNVAFTDASTGIPTSWSWNFGDGNTSNSQNPTHTYYSAGSYTVNLTVSNMNGTASKTATIAVFNESNMPPIADFSTSVTSGYAPLSVTFTDLSQDATSRSWDVNNDGIEDSNETSFVYEYASEGTYTANLTARNANGTNSKTVQIIVYRRSSSGGGSSGGGGGGSPEPATNVKVKELSQVFITNGNPVKFNFPKNATDVVYLSFDSKKTVGKTTTIVEMLKNKSKLTPDAPEGEVYNYLNIWVGNSGYATEKNIENAVVCFKVEKSWIQDKGIDQSSIILNRYSDKKWNPLTTRQSGDDEKYMYFTTETPGFSPFSITGENTAKETVTELLPEPDTQDLEQNGNPDSEVEETSEPKEKTSMPGFEMIYCVIGLLGVFLYRRR